jgi:hypothetical protein
MWLIKWIVLNLKDKLHTWYSKPYCLQALFENIMIELQNEDEGRYTQLLQKMQ